MSYKRLPHDLTWETSQAKRSYIPIHTANHDNNHHFRDASPFSHADYTIAWVCALPLELEMSLNMFDERHPQLPNMSWDQDTYMLGSVGRHNVVMVCLPGQYGTNSAATVRTHLESSFTKIRATLMVGIGGGCPSQADLYLGDVVVGMRVMQYDMGKMRPGNDPFQATGIPKVPSPLLNSVVCALQAQHSANSCNRITTLVESRIPNLKRPSGADLLFQASYQHPSKEKDCDHCDKNQLQTRPERFAPETKIHYGVIASGNTVVKDGKARDDLAQLHNALCFEMESAGMMDHFQCLPIRGISDYADSHKNKGWQRYAAANAAAYARQVLETLSPLPSMPAPQPAYMRAVDNYSTPGPLAERRRALLESLRFPQMDTRKTTITDAQKKTCSWLIQHPQFLEWQSSEKQSENSGFFWIRGKAGAGKSTIMKFLYMKTKPRHQKPDLAVASFFFNARGEYLEKSVSGMYRSILLQLCEAFSDLQSALEDADIVPSNQQDCPNLNQLKALLERAVKDLGQRSFICFIDALDECDEHEVRDMVRFFEDLTDTTAELGIQLRICFSSRPYPYIEVRQGIIMTLEAQEGHGDDLRQYVERHLRIADPLLRLELKQSVLDRADGIFMWIVLVVDILNHESSYGALALRKRASEIPTRLSDLFRSILKRDSNRPLELRLCILWVLCAKRPLSPKEFRHALWAGLLSHGLVDNELPNHTESDALSLITSSSKGLVEITNSKKDPRVQFIHQSVPDFLVKEKGLQDIWHEAGFNWEGPCHEELKRCCNSYLSLPDLQSLFTGTITTLGLEAHAEQYSFLQYASRNILHHSEIASKGVPQADFLSNFFSSSGINIINLFQKHQIRQYSHFASPLYILADQGLANLVTEQLKEKKPVRAPVETFHYPLFAAIANGHARAVSALLQSPLILDNGVNLMEGLKFRKNLQNYKYRTPLTWAIQEGRLEFAKVLIRNQAHVNETDMIGVTPIIEAVKGAHREIVQILLDEGADVNARNADSTALQAAAWTGNKELVQMMLDRGADVNLQDRHADTALHHASRRGYTEIVQMLLSNGADVNARNESRIAVIDDALSGGHAEIVQMLLDNGADVNCGRGRRSSALCDVSRRGYKEIMRMLLDKGVDVNAHGELDDTALYVASEQGHTEIVQMLISKGADANIRSRSNRTALYAASEGGHTEIVQMLIDNGADVDTQGGPYGTALSGASAEGHAETVLMLLRNGADVNIRGGVFDTALSAAKEGGHREVVHMLLDKGAVDDA